MGARLNLVIAAALAATAVSAHAESQGAKFHATMDRIFGPGAWRQTSGYRTKAQEEALRREGAGTVAPGRTSLHSIGRPGAPGAYDAVVSGMSTSEAAAALRRAAHFQRVVAERAHGPQGPHLHIEVASGGAPPAHVRRTACNVDQDAGMYLRIVNGRRNPLVACEGQPEPVGSPDDEAQ